MRGVLSGIVIGFVVASTPGVGHAAQNQLRVYPNANLRAFAFAQGPDGFIWLAAEDGLYRFDGFHCQKIKAFPLASARFLGFTRDGSLWAGDYQGLVRMQAGRFVKILDQPVMGLAAYPDQVFVQAGNALAQVTLDGAVRWMDFRVRRELNIDASGRLWGVCMTPHQICWIDPGHPDTPHRLGDGGDFYEVLPDAQGRLWAADGERAVRLGDRPERPFERRPSTEGNRPSSLLAGGSGRIWFLGETPRELISGAEFRDRADSQRFAPLAGVEDSAGHLWVNASGRGLVEWIPDQTWERWFPENFSQEAAALIQRDRDGTIVAATHKHIYRKQGSEWNKLTSEERRYDSLIPFDGGGFLAAIRDFGVARLSASGAVLERIPDLFAGRNQYREIVRDAKGRYWVGAKEGLVRIEGTAGSLRFTRQRLPGLAAGESDEAVDLEIDETGRLWVGYVAGLAWLDENDQWHRIETTEPVSVVRSIAVRSGDIWVAYRKPGIFSRLVKNGERWTVSQFSYLPRDTYFVKRDSRGWIWRGTPNGVYISDGRHWAAEDWLHLHMGNGLAANELDEYGFFEDTDGSVWISGEEGVTHLRPDAAWFQPPPNAPPPRVTRVEADGQDFLFQEDLPAEMPASLKTLRIDLGTLSASPLREAPLRWRLLPSKEWRASLDGTLEFRNLPTGKYSLQAAYPGGEPSMIFSFQIGAATRWISWLWWLAPAGVIAPFALRGSVLAKSRFQIEKSMFLLRRRLHRSAADSVPNDWSGAVLNGRYRVGSIVSRGGFSIVYHADDLQQPGSHVAVKVLSRTPKKDGWIRDRFAHEVSALRSIEHPGIVRILDSWISPEGEPCLAMPFLGGETLRHAMRRFDRARAATLIRQIGDALGAVHGHGVVHRDLKPENIILMENAQPVIVDFGSAGLRSAENELAETTLIAGSFHYMAPERLIGRYSPATDVYAFGVIVLELLSGKRLADLRASFSEASFVEEISDALGSEPAGSLLAPAFDPDPRRRPASVREWANEIAEAIAQTKRPS